MQAFRERLTKACALLDYVLITFQDSECIRLPVQHLSMYSGTVRALLFGVTEGAEERRMKRARLEEAHTIDTTTLDAKLQNPLAWMMWVAAVYPLLPEEESERLEALTHEGVAESTLHVARYMETPASVTLKIWDWVLDENNPDMNLPLVAQLRVKGDFAYSARASISSALHDDCEMEDMHKLASTGYFYWETSAADADVLVFHSLEVEDMPRMRFTKQAALQLRRLLAQQVVLMMQLAMEFGNHQLGIAMGSSMPVLASLCGRFEDDDGFTRDVLEQALGTQHVPSQWMVAAMKAGMWWQSEDCMSEAWRHTDDSLEVPSEETAINSVHVEEWQGIAPVVQLRRVASVTVSS